jgi:hypothetical protein
MKLNRTDKVVLLFASIAGIVAVLSVVFPLECGDAYTANFGWDNPFGLSEGNGYETAVCREHPLPSLYSSVYSLIALLCSFGLRKLANYIKIRDEKK